MRSGGALLLGAGLVVALAGSAFGQSLGAVAKQAEDKRKTVKSTGKVYTNDNLKGASAPSPAQSAPAGPPAAEPSPSGVSSDPKAKTEPAKDEATWRDRIRTERDALAKAQAFTSALQSQINGLYAEFTACQAPTQCNDVSARRQAAMAELDRQKKEVETRTKAIADIQDEARKAGVPAGWVR
jgi:hypothetical protein